MEDIPFYVYFILSKYNQVTTITKFLRAMFFHEKKTISIKHKQIQPILDCVRVKITKQ